MGSKTAFARWLDEQGITAAEAARVFGVALRTVYKWRQGERAPTRARAVVIERLTKGRVAVSSWGE